MDLSRNFSRGEITMSNNILKYSTSLDTRKKQIKTTLKFILIPVRIAIMRKLRCCSVYGEEYHYSLLVRVLTSVATMKISVTYEKAKNKTTT